MGGLIVAGEIKTPNLIDMLVFAYASSEHDCNYKYFVSSLSVFRSSLFIILNVTIDTEHSRANIPSTKDHVMTMTNYCG